MREASSRSSLWKIATKFSARVPPISVRASQRFCRSAHRTIPIGSGAQSMRLFQPLLPSALLLTTIVPSVSYLYLPARTAVHGQVVCEHPEPYDYCALTRDGLFELTIGREGY